MLARATTAARTYARALRTLPKDLLLASPPRVRRALGPAFFAEVTPKFLWIEATSACGNRCKFCSIGLNVPQSRALTPSELEYALRDPLFRRLRIVVVSGGEPTLRPDLDKILTSVHRAVPAARIVLSTSAPLPERVVPVVEAALRAGVRLEVGVSVDGVGPKHDQMRGVPGLFDKVDQTLRELSALRRAWGSRLRVIVSMVICDDTVDDVDDVRRYAKSLGASFNPQWYNQAAYYGNVGHDRLTQTTRLLKLAKKLEPTLLNAFAERWLRGRAPEARCTMLFNACLLKSNGDFVPCFSYWNDAVGNIRTRTPSQIWSSPRATEVRTKVMRCDGCLNACGVVWSYDADYLGRGRFFLRHPRVFAEKVRDFVAAHR